MSKPEVQSLVALILRCAQVHILLLIIHGVPPCSLGLVPPHVVPLDEDNESNVPRANGNKHLVPAVIIWLIVLAIDL